MPNTELHEMAEYLTVDEAVVRETLASAPFVVVDGVFNIRDFGNARTVDDTGRIKLGHLFRSGEPTHITDAGKEKLQGLGITTLFDLRATNEVERHKAPPPEIPGVTVVKAPVIEHDSWEGQTLAKNLKFFEVNELQAFMKTYTAMLEVAGPAVRTILLHLRDKPQEPFLVFCTAGKDRTGLLAALILMLLGAPDEHIIADYSLSYIGLQPVVPLFVARFEKEPIFQANRQGVLNMGTSRPETMKAMIKIIREDFGGVENYVKRYAGLTDMDILWIRRDLIAAD